MPVKSFSVSNFVLTKIGEEWFEGRVVGIDKLAGDQVLGHGDYFYRVYLFGLYSEMSQPIKDHLLFSATSENMKKFRITPLRKVTKKPHIPPSLKKIMDIDKENAQKGHFLNLPARQTVSKILDDFKNYIQVNKPSIFEEELEESILGFFYMFENTLIPFLLYKKEKTHVKVLLSDIKNQQKADIFGPEYLLRAIYLMQVVFLDKIDCEETKDMVFDYSVYLLDFLSVNTDRYFVSQSCEI